MPLSLTVSCFSKIQIGFTFLVPAHPGGPGKRAVKWVCVCVLCYFLTLGISNSLWPKSKEIKAADHRTLPAENALKTNYVHARARTHARTHTHTHTHTCNGPLSRTARVSWYQKGKTNLDFTEARDSEWQWHQLGHMQVCT